MAAVHKFADLQHELAPIEAADRASLPVVGGAPTPAAEVHQTPGQDRALSAAAKKGLPQKKKSVKQRRRVHASCPVLSEADLVADGGAPRSPQRQRRFGSQFIDMQQQPLTSSDSNTSTAVPFTPSQLRKIPGAGPVEDPDKLPRPMFAEIADSGLGEELENELTKELAELTDEDE
eukprot:TRINITY_DN229_c0_g1_i1.p2 TRINITY_DN229_c0_g1~~TRINITY_DN229_c0_g1_i1.p2  ORF type:complete len:176 (-),score=39.50 TRINITY_DN229_c0_g1_i1:505-1032(-)